MIFLGTTVKSFMELYKHALSIHDLNPETISKKNYETYKVFSLKKGLPVKLVITNSMMSCLPRIKYLIEDIDGKAFYRDNEAFWLVPIETATGNICGFILRSYSGKTYRIFYDGDISPMFGFYSFTDFNSELPVLLTEGCKDAIYLKTIYPYVLSLNTKGITRNNIQVLTRITSRVILVYDNDSTGNINFKKDYKRFTEAGLLEIDSIKPYLKDCAEYSVNDYTRKAFLKELTCKIRNFGGVCEGDIIK